MKPGARKCFTNRRPAVDNLRLPQLSRLIPLKFAWWLPADEAERAVSRGGDTAGFATQTEQRGTGDAVMAARAEFEDPTH
jgi:hypothetical protein